MLRREFVRVMMAAGIAPRFLLAQQTANPAPPPPAPVPWTLGLNPKTPLPETEAAGAIAGAEPSFFSEAQMGTLTRLCDVLFPSLGGKPGAIQTETPLFLDFLIGSSPRARKTLYTGGLSWLDAEAKQRFGRGFDALDDTQADSVLKPWLRTWMTDHPPTEAHADFINIANDDIRTATFNSKAWDDASSAAGRDWVTGGLYWSRIEPEMYGEGAACSRLPAHVQAVPKAAHTMPSYPR
jgi:hypothetical protein